MGVRGVAGGGGSGGSTTAAKVSYVNTASGLTAVNVQAAIDEIIASRIAPQILLSSQFKLVGDNATDNDPFIVNWIAAANAIITAGGSVKMTLTPGVYRWSGRATVVGSGGFTADLTRIFPGNADVEFDSANLVASGAVDTERFFQHGTDATGGIGTLRGINVSSVVTTQYLNPGCVGVTLNNKFGSSNEIVNYLGFTKGLQLRAATGRGFCAYNDVKIGQGQSCKFMIDVTCATADTSFPSDNTFHIGNAQGSSSFNNFGSIYGLTLSREYQTGGYAGHSGNWIDGNGFQLGTVGLQWAASTLQTAGFRYFSAGIGGEWLCLVGGASGTVEPSILPAVVTITGITLTQGSANITMASTAGIVVGMQLKGTNPASAFPLNTTVTNVVSGTTLTLSNPSFANSANFIGQFITPTVDGASTLVYLGPYRRSPVWLRDCGANNGVEKIRMEDAVGEALCVTGPDFFPLQPTAQLGRFIGTFHTMTNTPVNYSPFPQWAAGNVYAAGDMVRPAVIVGTYWDCLVGGTSGGAEPTPSTNVNTQFVDNGVTWIVRALPTTAARGDWGQYVNAAGALIADAWNIQVGRPFDEGKAVSGSLNSLQTRAIGSAAGWLVRGACKCTGAGVLSSNFTAGAFTLSREGLFHNNNNEFLGAILRTDKSKSFVFKKHPGTYTNGRAHLVPLDKGFQLMTSSAAAQAYHQRIQSWCGPVTGSYAEPSDNASDFPFSVDAEVPYVFCGMVGGAAPGLVITGFSIVEALHRVGVNSDPTDATQLFTLHGDDYGFRSSLGTPTSGYFLFPGEYINNASAAGGFEVATAGIVVPPWVTGTAYKIGQLVSAGGNVYAANGAFTSGTTPSGTTQNFLDVTASAITAGNVATWDYQAPVAVLTVVGVATSPVLSQTSLPMILGPSAFMANNGAFVIGQTPAAAATATFGATSGAGVSMTLSSADLLGTSADVGRVLTILDTTYKYATITAFGTTATATVTLSGGALSGLGPFANSAIWLSGSPTTNTTAYSVPLGTVYANAYMYFPAGAIAAGSAAGWYFVQMASTTQGTVFNNVYASGTPVIPGSPTAFATTGPGAYAQQTTNITGLTVSLAGNTLGVNGELQLDSSQFANNSAGTKTAQFLYGGTLLGSVSSPASGFPDSLSVRMRNAGVANTQTSPYSSGSAATLVTNLNRAAIDSTANQNVTHRMQISSAATDWIALEGYSLKLYFN